jgi:diguanylate cyclase (GGDEF)-like protein
MDAVGSLAYFKELLDEQHITYDYARLVDPVTLTVLEHDETGIDYPKDGTLARYWSEDTVSDTSMALYAWRKGNTISRVDEIADGKRIVVIALPTSVRGRAYVVELIRKLEGLAFGKGVPFLEGKVLIEQLSQLEHAAVLDDLTGLFNRAYLYRTFRQEVASAREKDRPLSVVFIDIDHFKQVNDTYGHLAGDKVIATTAHRIQDEVRVGSDWVARYGGDEFFICLRGADEKAAEACAERICDAFRDNPIQVGERSLDVTVSAGVATLTDGDTTGDALIELADERMYQQKEAGRTDA